MSYALELSKKRIISLIQKELDRNKIEHELDLELPPDEKMGDFAFPCFSLAPIFKKSPEIIAQNIVENIGSSDLIEKIEAKGGYVNFFLDKKFLSKSTLDSILNKKEKYGHLEKKSKKVIIEHTSANPNGPLHVGRARNPIIGDTLVRIYKAAGFNVESQFYLDDLGKQVAILTWGFQNLKPNEISKSDCDKPDHKMVGFYQKANSLMEDDDAVNQEISEIVHKSEHGDKKTLDIVHRSYSPVLEGIKESLDTINIFVDKYIPESKFVKDKSVEKVVKKLKESKHCGQEDNAYFLDLDSFGIKGRNTKFFFTRKDGTTLYATRDIAYHLWKAENADELINVLGEDHKLESKQVEIALNLMQTKIIPSVIFYAFVSLPGGKMSTRRGRVVYLDDLVEESIQRAYIEVKKRRGEELSEQKMNEIAKTIAIGALRYNIIKVQPEKDIVFKWEEALNFEGNSAPFIQYSHARACSILHKMGKNDKKFEFFEEQIKHESEISLVKAFARFPMVIENAYKGFKPHVIASYLFETAAKFNQFYRDCPVLSEKNDKLRKTRLALVYATKIVLNNGLDLLGITAPEEM